MICDKYNNLSIPERTKAIGELIHMFQNDDDCFTACLDLIQDAKMKGIFNGVVVNPPSEAKDTTYN